MKLEEIKERMDNYKSEYLPYFNNNREMREWNQMFQDVQFLFYRLQIAEEYFQKILDEEVDLRDPDVKVLTKYAQEALKLIRGE